MKNKFFHFVLIAVLSYGIFMFTGCASLATPQGPAATATAAALRLSHESYGSFAEAVIPIKDFQPVGLVFTTTTFRIDSRDGIIGNAFSYQDLLREAHALGAHGIINVTIDRQTRNVTINNRRLMEVTIRASALAIRYTGVITGPVQANHPRAQRVMGGGSVVTETPPEADPARR